MYINSLLCLFYLLLPPFFLCLSLSYAMRNFDRTHTVYVSFAIVYIPIKIKRKTMRKISLHYKAWMKTENIERELQKKNRISNVFFFFIFCVFCSEKKYHVYTNILISYLFAVVPLSLDGFFFYLFIRF